MIVRDRVLNSWWKLIQWPEIFIGNVPKMNRAAILRRNIMIHISRKYTR